MGLSHLARRGAELASMAAGSDKDGQPRQLHISPFGIVAMVFIHLFMAYAAFIVQYTLSYVVSTLAIVEEPHADVVVEVEPLAEDGTDATAKDQLLESNIAIVKARPITSSLHGAMRHLRAQGGRLSYYRGFSLYIVYTILAFILTSVVLAVIPGSVGLVSSILLPQIILCRLEMAWYQIVISKPSPKPWYRRLQTRKYWKKVAPAATIKAVASLLTFGLPVALFCVTAPVHKLSQYPSEPPTPEEAKKIVRAAIGALIAFVALLILVTIPAYIIMVRVSASLISEEDETIVAFDRTFGGRVTPMIIGGAGKIGIVEAWKTFSWEARRRFLGLMFKIGAVAIALGLFNGFVLAGATRAFVSVH